MRFHPLGLALLLVAVPGVVTQARSESAAPPGRPAIAVAADFDGDGAADVASADQDHMGSVVLSRSRHDELRIEDEEAAPIEDLIAVDVDHDGDTDLIAATRDDLVIWINSGHGEMQMLPRRSGELDVRPSDSRCDSGETQGFSLLQARSTPSGMPAWIVQHGCWAASTLTLRDLAVALPVIGSPSDSRGPPSRRLFV